jgi:hypothetical protein
MIARAVGGDISAKTCLVKLPDDLGKSRGKDRWWQATKG